MHYRIRYLSLAALLTVAAAWLWAHEGHQPLPTRGAAVDVERGLITLSPKAVQALDVHSEPVRAQLLDERIVAPAVLVAPWQRYAFATSRIEGQITALLVKPGQTVQAGQPLAEVQSLELENLQLELVNAVNDIEVSAVTLAQLETAARNGALTPQEVQEARTRHQENIFTLTVARRKLHSLGVDDAFLNRLQTDRAAQPLKSLPIRSPIAGEVVHADVRIGQAIQPTDHLIEVVDLSRLWVQVRVLERDWLRITVGQTVEVRLSAYPTEVFRGTVEVKGQALDPDTYLGTVWASISAELGARSAERKDDGPPRTGFRVPRFLPGMYGQAEVILPSARKTLTVPAAAIIRDGVERYVLLEEGPAQYVRKNVVTGRASDDRVEILQTDIGPADRVVTTGSHELASLLPVTVLRPSKQAEQTIGLQVEPARKRSIAETVTLAGIVDLPPAGRAVVSSRLSGVIERVHMDRSQPVEGGQVVAEIASLEFQQLQLDLLRQHLQAELLRESLDRLRSVGDRGNAALNRRQLREAESAYHTARQRRDSLQRKLEAVGLAAEQVRGITEKRKLVDTLPIRSPITGVVVNFPAKLGQFVKAEDPLFEVHDLAHPLIHGFVSERDLPRVGVGQRASIRLTADPWFHVGGKLARLGQLLGSMDHTLSVWVELAEPAQQPLLAGMMARLTLYRDESPPVLAVPLGAILRQGNRAYVFVRQPDGVFARRAVEAGRSDDQFIEIVRGVTEGESVAVQGVTELQTGYASLK